MIHNWQFTQMWKYFDYNSNAIYNYSEEIAKLSDEIQKQIYADISSRMKQYICSLIPNPEQLYQFVGIVINDIYRTMNTAAYYTHKQQAYLNSTAKIVIETLEEHHINVHFGTNNSFSNAVAVKLLFSAMYEDCGLCFIDVYTIAAKLEGRDINNHEGLIDAYKRNKGEVNSVICSAIKRLHAISRSYALIVPDGAYSDFEAMLNIVETPGHMVFYKDFDADSPKYTAFDYLPPRSENIPRSVCDTKEREQINTFASKDTISNKSEKKKNSIKSIFKVFPLIFAIILGFVFFRSTFLIGFYQGNGDIYYADRDDMDMILQMNQDGTMSIYQYSSTVILGAEHYYGLQTQYEYYATLYNNVIGPLHSLPEERLPFWKRFAFFDGSKQERALVEMKAVSNKGLMVDVNKTEAVSGVFRELLIIEDKHLTLGDISFIKAEGEQLALVNDVVNDFLKYNEIIP